VSPVVRRTWPFLAVVAGALLIYFECRHGVTADGVFWLVVGGLIIVLGVADLAGWGKGAEQGRQRGDDQLPLE
jgi:hypothetical protein